MNNVRRAKIGKIAGLLGEMVESASALAEEEREYYDNMPEGLQSGERGTQADHEAEVLEGVAESLRDALSSLGEIA